MGYTSKCAISKICGNKLSISLNLEAPLFPPKLSINVRAISDIREKKRATEVEVLKLNCTFIY